MTVEEKLNALCQRMKEEKIDVYYIPTNDFHGSEYLCDYFKCREYMSGFDGSAGTLIVWGDGAGLWTDGRYFLQAEQQLSGSGITLYRSGMEGVPTIKQFLLGKLVEGQTFGVDGRMVFAGWMEEMEKELSDRGISVRTDLDFVGDIWKDRPDIPKRAAYLLQECYCGQSRKEKIEQLHQEMKQRQVDFLVLTSLDDIAWLLNLRGSDVHCNPVVMAFLIATAEGILLFVHTEAFSDTVKTILTEDGVQLREYEAVYRCLQMLPEGSRVMLDKGVVNARILQMLSQVQVIDSPNPTVNWKAVKNQIEIENIRKAHVKDGVAITKLLFWIKSNVGQIPLTECSVIEKLEEFRNCFENYVGPSFDTIAGYAEHGAIVHYTASEKTDKPLAATNFLLLDMGGHYLEGTTDVTRTVWLGGDPSGEQKRLYTAVLRGNLALCAAKFLYGCCGVSLDILARKPLWELGYNYDHGTGHGVGYLLNVHEGPNAFRYRILEGANENAVLEEGMVTSDEPGVYLAGQYGIRLENLILCVRREKTEFGQFMGFEPLTLVPFERRAINAGQMSEQERTLLDEYHRFVYETISPYLTQEEQAWLKEECAPIL